MQTDCISSPLLAIVTLKARTRLYSISMNILKAFQNKWSSRKFTSIKNSKTQPFNTVIEFCGISNIKMRKIRLAIFLSHIILLESKSRQFGLRKLRSSNTAKIDSELGLLIFRWEESLSVSKWELLSTLRWKC